MTKPIDPEAFRKALETAAALELAAQSAWQERSRAIELFESSWTDSSAERRRETRQI